MHALRKFFLAACLAPLLLDALPVRGGELPAVSGPTASSASKAAAASTTAKASPRAASPCRWRRGSACRPTALSGRSTTKSSAAAPCTFSHATPRATCSASTAAITRGIQIDIWRAALEGELYIGRVTLEGLGGYESLDAPELVDGLNVLTLDDNHFFGQADAAYYITDDFKVNAGYRYINEASFGAAGAEYLIRGFEVPMSLFARGDFGDENITNITGGLRIYLSDDPQRSLIDSHRRDDPEGLRPDIPHARPRDQGNARAGAEADAAVLVNGSTRSRARRTATASALPGR